MKRNVGKRQPREKKGQKKKKGRIAHVFRLYKFKYLPLYVYIRSEIYTHYIKCRRRMRARGGEKKKATTKTKAR